MGNDDIEYGIIKNSIRTLGLVCSANENQIIDLLTGYLWDEEEAGAIKRSAGEFKIRMKFDKQH